MRKGTPKFIFSSKTSLLEIKSNFLNVSCLQHDVVGRVKLDLLFPLVALEGQVLPVKDGAAHVVAKGVQGQLDFGVAARVGHAQAQAHAELGKAVLELERKGVALTFFLGGRKVRQAL